MPDFLAILFSPELHRFLLPFKLILGILGIVMFVFIAVMLFRTSWLNFKIALDLNEFLTSRPFGLRKISGKWQKTKQRLETGNEAEWKLAIIEADAMLDDTLKRMGLSGQTVGEKLDTAHVGMIPNLSDLREAHKLRNGIVYDPNYRLPQSEARRTLEIYEMTFQHLDLV